MPTPSTGNSTGVELIQYGNDTSNIQFGYDAGGNIIALNYVANGVPMPYTISYLNGIPNRMVNVNSTTNLTFNNGLIQKADLYNNNGQNLQSSVSYTYANNQLQTQSIYQQTPTGLTLWIKYQYSYLTNSDLDSITVFAIDFNTGQLQQLRTFKCTYDTHPNPLLAVNNFYIQFYGIPASAHNVTQVTVYDIHNAVILTASYNYTYRQDGYPVSADRTLVQPGAAPELTHIKYLYQ